MFAIAFTMGLVGSLHCLGMCGPLAFGVASLPVTGRLQQVWRGLNYNFGRIISYSALGLLIGSLGDLVLFHDYQQQLSVGLGVSLILLSVLSLDIEKLLHRSSHFRSAYSKIQSALGAQLSTGAARYPAFIGMINGLLPCGMVYLALAAAASSGSLRSSVLTMSLFGLGTIPMMLLITILPTHHPRLGTLRRYASRVLPLFQLALGVFLIYRGIYTDTPVSLDYWIAKMNPVMCH